MESNNTYWEKEEFEDLVARSLIAMYETDINKKCRKVPKYLKVSDSEFLQVRINGCYFSPNDRVGLTSEIDLVNDGLPKIAIQSYIPKKLSWLKNEYITSKTFFKINLLPKPFLCDSEGIAYKQVVFQASATDKIWLHKSFVLIDDKGQIWDTFVYNDQRKKVYLPLSILGEDEYGELASDISSTAITFGLYQDRKFLWNVCAKEGIAKATFGVYPEQIKSLFYAREMPMTETGRKRPILHWVAAHQRRLKNGIDIDIEKHLRGTNEFVYQGTKFIITNPQKTIR